MHILRREISLMQDITDHGVVGFLVAPPILFSSSFLLGSLFIVRTPHLLEAFSDFEKVSK